MASKRFAVRLTLSARQDLDSIHDYLMERGSPAIADDFLETVLDKIASLERYPRRGPIPAEVETLGVREIRQVLVGTYRLIYRVRASTVSVIAVADGGRNMQTFLEKRLLGR
jgi:toxin ParE1/3/4